MKKRRFLVLAQWAVVIGALLTLTGCPDLLGSLTDEPTPPSAPGNLQFTGITSTSITISWDEVEGATSYTLLRDTAYNGTFATEVYSGSNTAAADDGLSPETTYYYKVRASNDAGNGPFSAVGDATTLAAAVTPAPTTAPSYLTSSGVTYNAATLSWDVVSGATKYELVRDTSSGGSFATIVYEGSSNTTDDTGLSANTTYYYKVRAGNSAGWGPYTSFVSLQTELAPVAPSTPANLTVDNQSESFIALSWDAVSGADSYQLYRSISSPVTTSDNLVHDGTATSVVDTDSGSGLAAGTTYYYAVRATNVAGSSAISTTIAGNTSAAATSAPSAPATISVSDAGADFITVTWASASGASSYTLYRSTSSPVGTSDTEVYSGAMTEFTDTGLASGTTYYYAVAASNSAGASGLSPEASETPAAPAAATPTNVTISGVSDTEVTISWDAVSDALEYQLERDTSTAFAGPTIVYNGGTNTSITDTGLSADTDYFYRVKARNSVGFGDYSVVKSVRTDPTPLSAPAMPGNFTASTVTESSIKIMWNAEADASGYILYADTVSPVTMDSTTRIYSGEDLSYTHTALDPETTYYFAVVAWNAVGNSPAATLSQATDAASATNLTGVSMTAVSVGTPAVDSLIISWPALSGASAYQVLVSEYPSTGGADTVIYDGPATSIEHSGIAAGTTHYYKVTAYNSISTSNASAVASGTTLPAKPAYPFIAPTVGFETTSVDIEWDAVSTNAAVGPTYEYRIATELSALDSATSVSVGGATYETVGSLDSGTTYYFQARAVLAGGNGPWSNTRSAATEAILPAPTGVSVTESGGDLTVSWTAVGGATAYDVLRGPTSGGPWTEIAIGETGTSYTDTGLASATVYWYAVVATDATGASERSTPAYGTTPQAIPTTPTGLSAVVIDAHSIAVSWDPVQGADSYVVTRNGSPLPEKIATSFTDSGLDAATTYEYTVAAKNEAGTGTASSPVSRTTMLAPPSSAPTGLTVDDATRTSIDLSWNAVPGATRYKVFRAPQGGGFSYIAQTMDPTVTFTDVGLNHSSSYEYKVSAANAAGEGPQSSAVADSTDIGLDAPAIIDAFYQEDGTILVEWYAVTGADGYTIERRADGEDWMEVAYGVTGTSYTDTSITEFIDYYYRVQAVDTLGTSYWSSSNRAYLPSPPSAPSLDSIWTYTDTTATVSWWDVESATSYELYRSIDSTVNESDDLVYSGADAQVEDTGLTAGTDYWYKVKAINLAGETWSDNTVSVTTLATPPPAPTNPWIGVSTTGANWIDLNFAVDDATSFQVYRSDDATVDDTDTLVYEGPDSWFTDEGLSPDTTYYYAVRGSNVTGTSGFSAALSATTDVALAPTTAPELEVFGSDYPPTAELIWSEVIETITGYKIYRSISETGIVDPANLLAEVDAGTTNYYDYDVTSPDEYYYAVVATNAGSDGPASTVRRAGSVSIIVE